MPPALLALDSWVTAVSALTSNCRTGLWWESSRVLVPSGCLVQDRQVRDPPGLKQQLGWGCQPGFDPSCVVMQGLDTSSPLWAYAKVPLLPFFLLAFSSCALCLAELHEVALGALMQLPDGPACCCLPGLKMLLTCLEGESEGAISSFSLLGDWFCVKMAFVSLGKGGGSGGEHSQMVELSWVPGTALTSGCSHFPQQFPGTDGKSLQSLHFDGWEGLAACPQLPCAHWLLYPYGCGLGVPGVIWAQSRSLLRGSLAFQCWIMSWGRRETALSCFPFTCWDGSTSGWDWWLVFGCSKCQTEGSWLASASDSE